MQTTVLENVVRVFYCDKFSLTTGIEHFVHIGGGLITTLSIDSTAVRGKIRTVQLVNNLNHHCRNNARRGGRGF